MLHEQFDKLDHLRHHHARRRAEPGRLHDARREAAHRARAGAHAGRRDRGRLPGLVQRRLRGGARDRQRGQGLDGLRPVPRQRPRHPARHRRAEGREGLAHPHLHRHQRAAHGEEAAHDARAGARAGEAVGALRAERLPGRRVLARGRHALGPRLPLPRARGGDQGRRDHHQHPGHRGLRGAGAVRRVHPQAAREDPEFRQGGLERALPQRPRHGGGQFARRGARSAARARSSARSTAWASARATPRSRRW